jgi:hypothetical protein
LFLAGSDDNAALYWLARMLKGGEDPAFIARRLVRCFLTTNNLLRRNPDIVVYFRINPTSGILKVRKV